MNEEEKKLLRRVLNNQEYLESDLGLELPDSPSFLLKDLEEM